MYEDQAGGKVYNTLFSSTNCQILGVTLSMVPMEDVMLTAYADSLSLMKEISSFALLQPDGTSTTPSQRGEEGLGEEVGMVLSYDYTEDLQLGARAGWFFPGQNYDNDSQPAETASQLIFNAKVAF
jgi:hypothetical protein